MKCEWAGGGRVRGLGGRLGVGLGWVVVVGVRWFAPWFGVALFFFFCGSSCLFVFVLALLKSPVFLIL